MIIWIILGAALLVVTALWYVGQSAPRATISSYTFLGDTCWRWECGSDSSDGFESKSAAIRSAELAGYYVEGGT